mmetsp:Transcript_9467/g.23239  ORF Transcript_9467/g.23239 Transcript_9467/m.23239 type:complete len:232 (-) Transcript_9467:84-779(-)
MEVGPPEGSSVVGLVGETDGRSVSNMGERVGGRVPISSVIARSVVLHIVMRLSSMKGDVFGSKLIPASVPTQQFGVCDKNEQKQDPKIKFEINENGRVLNLPSIPPRLRTAINIAYSSSLNFESAFKSLANKSSTQSWCSLPFLSLYGRCSLPFKILFLSLTTPKILSTCLGHKTNIVIIHNNMPPCRFNFFIISFTTYMIPNMNKFPRSYAVFTSNNVVFEYFVQFETCW